MRELDVDETRAVVAIQRLQAAYADVVTRRDWAAVRLLFENSGLRACLALPGKPHIACFALALGCSLCCWRSC